MFTTTVKRVYYIYIYIHAYVYIYIYTYYEYRLSESGKAKRPESSVLQVDACDGN